MITAFEEKEKQLLTNKAFFMVFDKRSPKMRHSKRLMPSIVSQINHNHPLFDFIKYLVFLPLR